MLERRGPASDHETLARDLLGDFIDTCLRWGLDGVLRELEQARPTLDLTDRLALADDPELRAALVEKLGSFDHRGPQNAMPRQLADCLIATLSLTLSDDPDRTIALPDAVRAEVTAALSKVLDVELAAEKTRAGVIAIARERCDAAHLTAFNRITAQLDERGARMIRQPKVPLHAAQAVQQALTEARSAVVEAAVRVALDRATEVLARASADAAARLDLPVTHRLTPREVAIARATDPRGSTAPTAVVHSVLETLTQLVGIAWLPAERQARPYAASQTFAVGELLDHPKFGRGSVIAAVARRIEVEFADGKHTLVHVGPTN